MIAQQQSYILQVEDKIGSLEVAENGVKVRVLGKGRNRPAIVPTTEELAAYVRDAEALHRLETVQADTLQQAEEKVAIAQQNRQLIDNVCKRLDADLEEMKQILQHTGEIQKPDLPKPNDLAAIQVAAGESEWILAKVIAFDPSTGMYRLSDEDIESNKIFNLPENQVIILGTLKNPSRGDPVFAVYPDTTSFYPAVVTQTVRKVSGGGGFVMVQFVDDSDENGVTHDKAVQLVHLMRQPEETDNS